MNIMEMDRQYIAGTYNRFPLQLVSGKGSLVRDVNGKEYVDLGSGIAVTSFGIADDLWADAVEKQLRTLQHTSNLYYTEPCALLAKALCERTGMKKVFFSNSGAEANECAIKAARKWAAQVHGPACSTVVTLKNSFHGRTLTTLAATGQDHYHELYRPLTPGFASVEAGDTQALEELLKTGTVAGILIECIQGEGGVVVLDPGYASALKKLVGKYDVLLMVDEVQTGNGRTGEFYAYMGYDLAPDVVSTAKGLGGGLPLGATLLGERVKDVFAFGDHGSTFGGNPAACAGALSIVDRLTDDFLAEVRKKGDMLREIFTGAPGILSVSGKGLMLGLETVRPAGEVVKACMENGVLCLTAKSRVRLLPALNIPESLLRKAADVILKAAAV